MQVIFQYNSTIGAQLFSLSLAISPKFHPFYCIYIIFSIKIFSRAILRHSIRGFIPCARLVHALSRERIAELPRYCRNYAFRFSMLDETVETRRPWRGSPCPLKVPLRGRGCNLTIVDLLAHSLTAWCQACV